MKNRWQKSLEAAVAAYDTPMPWARGNLREAMIARRSENAGAPADTLECVAKSA